MTDGHGDDSYKYKREIVSNFSSNVYNKVDLSGLKNHLCTRISSISSYPEPEPYSLERQLAEVYHISAQSVCVTNGATEAIYLIAQAFRGSQTVIVNPTFSEYADACRLHQHQLSSISDLVNLSDEVQMVWLCNPNNPTGRVYSKSVLSEYINRYPQVCFVVDQSYEHFTLRELFTAAEALKFPNLILLHSMTKCYAIPGLRLGYFTASSVLLNKIRAHRMPWSVNQLAIEAGGYLLDNVTLSLDEMAAYLHEKERLCCELEMIEELTILPSDTHFFLVKLAKGEAADLKEYLANEHGLLIRNAANFQGLDGSYFRIATQTPEENNQLINAIKQWILSI